MCSQICSLLSSLNNSFVRSPPGPSTSSADPLPLSCLVACPQGLHHLLPASTSSPVRSLAPRALRQLHPASTCPPASCSPPGPSTSHSRPVASPQGLHLLPRWVAQSPKPSTSSPDSLRRPRRVARSPTPSTSSPDSLHRPRRVAAIFTCLGTPSRLVLQEP
ncbi:hypothetical protein PCANC_18062 [Puccinia coronata f. sp. avenae]|uniref:Uncharacterized protein n=1 Tax=Puccinia coronata f. sp. avenae TaxID=200324 RepID=A0A2N5UJ32_9BASI|nr:hypothetical protein PCANC_18062 [Puccinia coronata f. sp. avenae]